MSKPNDNKEYVIDDVYRMVTEVIQKWIKQKCLAHADFEKYIIRLLDRNMEEIICKLLGFNIRYGETWKLDHCNGRAGESAAGQYLRSKAQSVINKWLDAQVGNVEEIVFDEQTVESLKSEIRGMFKSEVRKRIEYIVQQRAETFSKNMIDRIKLDEAKIKDSVAELEFLKVFGSMAKDDEKEKK